MTKKIIFLFITVFFMSITILCFLSCSNVKPFINKNVPSENIEPIRVMQW